MINLCIPVLKRYDLLRQLFQSLQWSTPKPDMIYVINNGQSPERMSFALTDAPCRVSVETPIDEPWGVAKSWNWFIRNVPEDRIICNDDLLFGPDSLRLIAASTADLVWEEHCGFSCFLIRDSCIEKLGMFDESISPGYGYYEDVDYLQRLDGKGTREPSAIAENVDGKVIHLKSQTLAANSPIEMNEHHRRFYIAQCNYMAKWGLTSL